VNIPRIERVLVNSATLIVGACAIILVYWWAINTFTLSTKFENPRVVGSDTYRVGDTIRLAYEVTRYRDCKLDIGRYVRRSRDRREVLMQSLTQIVPAGNPAIIRYDNEGKMYTIPDNSPPRPLPSGYVAIIPAGLLNPGETRVDADVFSRGQYTCKGLDWLWPRIVDMEAVKIVVVE